MTAPFYCLGKIFLPALKGRFRDRRDGRFASLECKNIIDDQLPHQIAGMMGSGADMREQNHMIHCDELRWNVGLIFKDIKAG